MVELSTAARIRVLIVVLYVTGLGLIVSGLDISAQRDFARDAVMRDANRHVPTFKRFYDLSPTYIWVPSDLFVWDSIRGRSLPVWDRLQGGGYSPLVNLQNGVFHPFRWLTAVFPRNTAPSVLILTILVFAGSGMFELLRDMGRSNPAALAGSALFTLGSGMMSTIHYSGGAIPMAHLPWLLLALVRSLRPGGRSWFFVLIGLSSSLLLSGHPLLVATVIGALLCFSGLKAAEQRNWSIFRTSIVAVASAALLTSFALIPGIIGSINGWTYKTQSSWGLAYRTYTAHSWLDLMQYVVLDSRSAFECCIDQARFWAFIGVPVVVLWIGGLKAAFAARAERTAALMSVALFLIALPGPWMKLISFRPLSYFKDWYWLGAFWVFLSIVASLGLDWAWKHRSSVQTVAAAAILLSVFHHGYRAWSVLDPVRFDGFEEGQIVEGWRNLPDGSRVTGLWGQTNAPNSARNSGIEDVRLVAPILPIRMHVWWYLVDRGIGNKSYPTTRLTNQLDSPLLKAFNVNAVVENRYRHIDTFHTSFRESSRDSGGLPIQGADSTSPLAVSWSSRLLGIEGPVVPRAHFAPTVVRVGDLDEAANYLARDGSLNWVVEIADPSVEIEGAPTGTVSYRYSGNSRVELQTENEKRGLLVFNDTYADGWRAEIDGSSVPIYPVNIVSRGVIVPKGKHRVIMKYTPPGFLPSLVISALTCVLLFRLAKKFQQTVAGPRD